MIRKYTIFIALSAVVACTSSGNSSSSSQDKLTDGIYQYVDYEYRHGAGSLENCQTRECETVSNSFIDFVTKETVTNGLPAVSINDYECVLPEMWISTDHHIDSSFQADCLHTAKYKVGDSELPISLNSKITLLIPESKSVNFELPKMYAGDKIKFAGIVKERIINRNNYTMVVDVTEYSSTKSD